MALKFEELTEGQIYIFRWSKDMAFYRGIFEGKNVRFIDFGNIAPIIDDGIVPTDDVLGSVSQTNIYNIKEQFNQQPFAYQ